VQDGAEAIELDLHDVSVGKPNAFAETQAVGPQEMNVDVAWPPVRFVLKVMMLDILQAMTHLSTAIRHRSTRLSL
jgi:hypothetical protein